LWPMRLGSLTSENIHDSMVPKACGRACARHSPFAHFAKPIAFADGTTVMAEYGAGTMKEIQIFYAPEYNYSVGGGHVELDSDETPKSLSITYARLNYLLHRWNLESAQANIFVWGGAGKRNRQYVSWNGVRRERRRTSRFRDARRLRLTQD
jgi:hypothetical protein